MTSVFDACHDALEFSKKSRVKNAAFGGTIKQLIYGSQRVQICFCVDCTVSMKPRIEAVKRYIRMFVDKMKEKINRFQVEVSFVGYRDWYLKKTTFFFFYVQKRRSFYSKN